MLRVALSLVFALSAFLLPVESVAMSLESTLGVFEPQAPAIGHDVHTPGAKGAAAALCCSGAEKEKNQKALGLVAIHDQRDLRIEAGPIASLGRSDHRHGHNDATALETHAARAPPAAS